MYRRYQSGKSYGLYVKYKAFLSLVNIFEPDDLLQEYELYKLEHNKDDCFDYFLRKLLRKAFRLQYWKDKNGI